MVYEVMCCVVDDVSLYLAQCVVCDVLCDVSEVQQLIGAMSNILGLCCEYVKVHPQAVLRAHQPPDPQCRVGQSSFHRLLRLTPQAVYEHTNPLTHCVFYPRLVRVVFIVFFFSPRRPCTSTPTPDALCCLFQGGPE